MSLCRAAAQFILPVLLVLLAAPAWAHHFVDSDGRWVELPPRVERVMAADPAAAVIVFVLNPGKLIGWPQPLTRRQRSYLPAKYGRLPVIGPASGDPAAIAAVAAAEHPDLIVGMQLRSPGGTARADQVERRTGIPYIVLDGNIAGTSEMLRKLGTILGVDRHGRDLRNYVEQALSAIRGKLLVRPANSRPRVYYGLGPDGLETGLAGSLPMEDIAQVGAVNVAASRGRRGGLIRITPEQLLGWDPAVIIAEDQSFYRALHRDPAWRGLSAVRNKRVYLAPRAPFGWIDDPPGVNRVIGLYWLTSVLYPDAVEQDLSSLVSDFYAKFYNVKLSDRQLKSLLHFATNPGEGKRPSNVPLLSAEPVPGAGSVPKLPPGALPMHPPGRGGLQNLKPLPSLPALPPLPGTGNGG